MKQKIARPSAFKPSPDIAWRRVENEVVLLHLGSSVYYSLNDAAARIWETLSEGVDEEGIARRLCEEYELKPEAARRDVGEFLRELRKEDLILPLS